MCSRIKYILKINEGREEMVAFMSPFQTLSQQGKCCILYLTGAFLQMDPLAPSRLLAGSKATRQFLSPLIMIGVLLQKGRGGLDLRPFPLFQTQHVTTDLGCLTDMMVLEGCHFLSTIRKGMDTGVTLQNRAISHKSVQASFLLLDCVWPPLISAAVLQDKATWLRVS